ncbi:MOSC domain-containing protein [Hellea balneolensis]|uniref:MOSC domain-containing protein n=1 Tax=Hellea balneolensis TaxID=287478 RepID=UPI0003F903DA|nr:MOSC domain-containing protein [Hellea balneolensis]
MSTATVIAVASDSNHNFSKITRPVITLIADFGVEGDAHGGKTVQHLSDKKKNPKALNLRQVHLMHAELFDELGEQGINVLAGQMGENIVTRGIDVLNLPHGAEFHFPSGAIIQITGLRSPCKKLNTIHPDLLKAVVEKRADGSVNKKTGVMSIVLAGGGVYEGDNIKVVLPQGAHKPLECV